MRRFYIPFLLLTIIVVSAGCTGTSSPAKSTFSVDSKGILTLSCAPVTINEQVLFTNETYTKSRIVMHTEDGEVVMYLAAPKNPTAAIVYAPGAGEKPEGHEERMVLFASNGYAFLFVDPRGNGGETTGIPFGQQLIQQDFTRFENGNMPQYYQSICDLISAQRYLSEKYHVPVYVIGSSNGGRYAAVAAGTDPQFAGYVGVSTSDWGLRDSVVSQGITGDPVRFATSIEPSTYLGIISPRPVWIYHAEKDPIIPYANGQQLYTTAKDPKTFLNFSGDHGINADVDLKILGQWAQIYAPRG